MDEWLSRFFKRNQNKKPVRKPAASHKPPSPRVSLFFDLWERFFSSLYQLGCSCLPYATCAGCMGIILICGVLAALLAPSVTHHAVAFISTRWH